MKIFAFLFLLTLPILSQNISYKTVTWSSGAISDSIDLGIDYDVTIPEYMPNGDELRAIGLWFDGTWTNTSLAVYACNTLGGTYDPVKGTDGTALTVTMASNTWVWLKPIEFAGLRYIRLVGSAEGGARTLTIIKRKY